MKVIQQEHLFGVSNGDIAIVGMLLPGLKEIPLFRHEVDDDEPPEISSCEFVDNQPCRAIDLWVDYLNMIRLQPPEPIRTAFFAGDTAPLVEYMTELLEKTIKQPPNT